MRRFASFGVAAVSAIALATPALTAPATAAPASSSVAASQVVAAKAMAKGKKFKIKKSQPGVQPGIAKMQLSVKGLSGKGKVKFKIAGSNGVAFTGKAKVKKGKAKYNVPALGTATYAVKASYKGRKGKTTFEVYDSAMTLSTTNVTCDISTYASSTPLSGSVKYKGGAPATGYVDFYKDGNVSGGSQSPSFLGFVSFNPPGSGQFNAKTDFCRQITSGTGLAGGKLAPLGVGTYNFQAYFTPTPSYAEYISSNFITVTVVP